MHQSFQMQIAASIALAIEQAGFRTQDEFARVIDMDRSTLRRVLSGNYDPKLSTLQRIAAGLEISIDSLLKPNASTKVPALKKRGRRPIEKPPVIQIQLTMAPGEELPDWLREAIDRAKVTMEQAGTKPRS